MLECAATISTSLESLPAPLFGCTKHREPHDGLLTLTFVTGFFGPNLSWLIRHLDGCAASASYGMGGLAVPLVLLFLCCGSADHGKRPPGRRADGLGISFAIAGRGRSGWRQRVIP